MRQFRRRFLSENCVSPVNRAWIVCVRVGQCVVAEPCRLALGVLAGDQFGAAAGLLQGDFAAQIGGQLRHAVRAHRRQRRVEVQRQQGAHLVERALRPAWRRSGWRWRRAGRPDRALAGSSRIARLKRCHGGRSGSAAARSGCPARRPRPSAGAAPHLPGAGDALAVVGLQAGGGGGIAIASRACSAAGADVRRSRARASARACGAGIGDVGQAIGERREIQAGAAGQDRQAARVVRGLHRGEGLGRATRRRCRLRGGADAVEGVRHARFLLRRRAGGEDAQLAIHLHGVGVDDGAAQALGQRQGERGLAAGGRAGNQHGMRMGHDGVGPRCIGFCRPDCTAGARRIRACSRMELWATWVSNPSSGRRFLPANRRNGFPAHLRASACICGSIFLLLTGRHGPSNGAAWMRPSRQLPNIASDDPAAYGYRWLMAQCHPVASA